MLKRAFDFAFSIGTLIVLAPLLLGVAVWIKLDSRGPVFFRQIRVGLRGREFRIIKFRSMRTDAPFTGPSITAGEDPRVTRAGRWLRRTKVDEFPQFFNVVLGDMSLVGPRPELPKFVATYPAAVRDLVLSVRPGITDPASLAYRHESEVLAHSRDPERTYREEVLPAKLAYCERYVHEQSFVGDLVIVARSIASIFDAKSSVQNTSC
jgi:lipopolysaccharide/colanic/teichoic acid biosynthesis glycosyltransferase